MRMVKVFLVGACVLAATSSATYYPKPTSAPKPTPKPPAPTPKPPAPTPKPATPAPPTPAQATPQPPAPQPTPAGVSHHVCLHYSFNGVGTFYDVVADASQTVLTRYDMSTNPPTLLGVNNYGPVGMPNPQGSAFNDGVAFAAYMQTQNAWMYPQAQQTSAAYWDVLGVDGDRWRFYAPGLEITLATEDCDSFGQPPAQATPQPPAPQPTPAGPSHHLCLHHSLNGVGTYYDVVADNSQTVLKRYNPATNPRTLLDTTVYGPLAMPNPQGSAFDVGVAFAAYMQTLGRWMYPQAQQTSAAYWDVLGADGDRWRFYAPGVEIMLATQNCEAF